MLRYPTRDCVKLFIPLDLTRQKAEGERRQAGLVFMLDGPVSLFRKGQSGGGRTSMQDFQLLNSELKCVRFLFFSCFFFSSSSLTVYLLNTGLDLLRQP